MTQPVVMPDRLLDAGGHTDLVNTFTSLNITLLYENSWRNPTDREDRDRRPLTYSGAL